MTNELKHEIEALLFASGRKMTIEELKMHLTISSVAVIKEALQQLHKEYEERQSPVMLVQEGDFWKLTTREKYLPLVRKINPNTELTKTMMETLAVIAWKQPITQSEVIAIRTNKAYDHIGELEKMGFLVKEKYGRTFMLKLTQKFFDYFDLRDAQAARDLFQHIKESEETQQKLEQARAAVESGLSPQPASEVSASSSETEEIGNEDLIPEDEQDVAENGEAHQTAVVLGNEEEDIENPADRNGLVEADEMKPEEATFVQGYEKDAAKTLEQALETAPKKKVQKKT